jgi:hypothetical protein
LTFSTRPTLVGTAKRNVLSPPCFKYVSGLFGPQKIKFQIFYLTF